MLLDIEGTTTSLSFVHDTLFPYAAEHLGDYVRRHRNVPEVARLLADARAYAGGDLDDDALVERMRAWIAADQQITPLKGLQGLIWEDGYRQGHFHGHVYPDVPESLHRWAQAGIRLYVFSSGSVHAQKLLFGHTPAGDLNPLFSGHFDTRIGGKRDADSYRRIAAQIGLPPEQILFLSDRRHELDAAAQVRMATAAVLREGVHGPFGPHRTVPDFTALDLPGTPEPMH
ncbi:2,3-diketo-5-methylthiopentyl-1-phosphate enolase-phosphatase [Thioalkalivibrio nitratireducens DSM 14787]|uniref:Enolase-phosphatase E1 n=1 Tax=Thioalkalivibrio nitratireducens (strain DSM 14787 / UNIQEM 213 / ALEN2) TaxID=1255043 RepID=L0E069_THIND|nr:2,3-diketo-5-methylthiopentyl-1-phosphate enolase-phosphatase [Thioalkalivibrio nitratireducens DSM 14787]